MGFYDLEKLILQVMFLKRSEMAMKSTKTAEEVEPASLAKDGEFGAVCVVSKDRLSGRQKCPK